MIEPLNHVLETQAQFRARQATYYRPATGDVAGEPFELPPAEPPTGGPQTAAAAKEFKLFGADGFNVFDMLDMINPLQHIPVISTIYRRVTGDELSPGARIVGATLLGGPIGAALAMADSAVEFETGKDTGANLYAALFGDGGPIPAADTLVAAAAPWQDPDLAGDTVTASAGSSAFVAATGPDLGALGALSEFTTAAGGRVALEANPAPLAQAWKNPDLEPLDVPSLALIAQMNEDTLALEAAARAHSDVTSVAANIVPKATPVAAPIAAPAPPPVPVNAALIDRERPMPSDAAKAQAINALAAMPTSQTSAAVAELAKADPRPAAPRHHMAPPAGDIPRGASASLNRKATSAYANMTGAKPTKAEVSAAADAHNAQVIAALERSAAGAQNVNAQNANAQNANAQNDWMLDSMQRAMAKYEASSKLRATAPGGEQNNAGGISLTR